MAVTPCTKAFTILENRDWKAWTGLPGACTLAEVKAHFPQLSDGNGQTTIGSRIVQAEFKTIGHPDFKKPIRVWYRDDQLILLELEYPRITDAPPDDGQSGQTDDGRPGAHELLSGIFGQPAGRLDYHQRTLLYKESAYIYPDRGLAILYNPDHSAVIRMYFFAPTTLVEYERTLHHPIQPARRLPARRSATP